MRFRTVLFLVLMAFVLMVAGCGAAGDSDSGGSTEASEAATEETDTEETDTEETDTEETDTEEAPTEEAQTEEAAAFDVAVLEASLKKSLSPSPAGGVSGSADQPKVQKVDCPDDVAGKTGEKFTCDASGEAGLAGSVDVELMNDEGTAYKYEGKLEADGFTTESSGTVSDG